MELGLINQEHYSIFSNMVQFRFPFTSVARHTMDSANGSYKVNCLVVQLQTEGGSLVDSSLPDCLIFI